MLTHDGSSVTWKSAKQNYEGNDHTAKPKVNSIRAYDYDDIIAMVISQAHIVTNLKEWMVDSVATKHICTRKCFYPPTL